MNPDDATVVTPQLEESMDPPSFTKSHCQKILEIESGAGLEDIHKMIEEKAYCIEQRLVKYESFNNGGDYEEQKDSRLSRENSSN